VTLSIYLKREAFPLDKRNRLDRLLLDRAIAGVKVYVLIWDESNLGVNLGSRWAKITLEKLHRYFLSLLCLSSLYCLLTCAQGIYGSLDILGLVCHGHTTKKQLFLIKTLHFWAELIYVQDDMMTTCICMCECLRILLPITIFVTFLI
jgi:hypothetical protein